MDEAAPIVLLGFTVMVGVVVIVVVQPVVIVVTNTLNVVFAVKFPEGRLIALPLPVIALPMAVFPELFLN